MGNLSPSLLIIVVALTAALLVGEERTQNMWKTLLTVQPNRVAVLSGKLTAAMLYLFVLLAGSLVFSVLFGFIGTLFLPTTFAGDWGNLIGLYGVQWAFALAAMLFAFLMVWLLRSLPLGIISIFFLPAVLEGGYAFYRAVVGFDRLNRFNAILEGLQLRNLAQELPRYFFTTNLYAPSRAPLSVLASLFGADMSQGEDNPFANLLIVDLNHAALVMACYALLFGALLYWSFTRRDIS
jgi:ABC-type transport system involved in multi-copper enzyme maturation permease subunit